MTWTFVGEHTFLPTDTEWRVGEFNLLEGQDTIWAKVTQLNEPGDWPFSFGILSWRSSEGNELGSIKIYPTQFGEVFRLTCGRAPLVGSGGLWFEPRGYNLKWVSAGYPWTLKFEAEAGTGGGGVTNQYWSRIPGTLAPSNEGDDVDLGDGSVIAKSGVFQDAITAPEINTPDGENLLPETGLWTPTVRNGTCTTIASYNRYLKFGPFVQLWGMVRGLSVRDVDAAVMVQGLPFDPSFELLGGSVVADYCAAPVAGCYYEFGVGLSFVGSSDSETSNKDTALHSDCADAIRFTFQVCYLTGNSRLRQFVKDRLETGTP